MKTGNAPGQSPGLQGEEIVSAAIVVIGDEILSGRTKDKNIGYIADYLAPLGIRLREVRIVADVEDEIVGAVNDLRRRYTYVFTTGGIGPTHDDITADAIAKAFDVPIGEDQRALAMMLERYKPEDLNAARRRMARVPEGAELVRNAVSSAPGFMMGNVIVMAGIPAVMQAMLDAVAPRLKTGATMLIVTIDAGGLPEGLYAGPLGKIAAAHPAVSVGSYPSLRDGKFTNQIVLRSTDAGRLDLASGEVTNLVDRLAEERRQG
jgi:molybdenum cofactor synthesis domain-containing protein